MADFFEASVLDDGSKEQLCRDLLNEFGVSRVKQTPKGELIHSCPLPFGGHRNGDRNPSASLNFRKLTFMCLTGDTLVKTYEGEFPIRDLAGRTVRLLDGRGKWVEAPVKHYGKDRIHRVTLTRNGIRKVVETTGDHRWYLRPKGSRESGPDGLVEKTTRGLIPGDRVPSVWAQTRTGRTTLSPVGIMAGFVFGDGSRTEHGSVANFVGPKDEALLPHFTGYKVLSYDGIKKIVSGLPRSWKESPSLDEGSAFLYGWLAGYFAADGCVSEDGYVTLSCAAEETLRLVVAICDRLGIATYTLSSRNRVGLPGREPSNLSTLSFRNSTLNPDFFLIPSHRDRFLASQERRHYERTHWWVSSVVETDRVEDVYCAEVPTTNSFVLAGNLLTGNCLGCGNSGGLLWFIAACRGETSEEARNWLNDQTGLGQSVMELGTLLKALDRLYAGPVDERPPIPRYSPSVLAPWSWNVQHPYMTDPIPEGRGIPESTLDRFGIGYAPEYFDGSERIIIPLWWRGELVGWQARHVGSGDHVDKYRNSPDFPRDRVIYNYDNGDRRSAVVVESPASVLRHHHHQPTMQATFGAQVTDDQVRLLQRYERVLLWFDNDPAGWKATERVGRELAPYNTVWVVNHPGREDPADLDDDPVDLLVQEAIPFALWKSPAKAGTSKEPRRGHSQVRHG